MAFVDGQEYTSKEGKKGTWVAQTGTFHVQEGDERLKFTAAEFGLEVEEPVNVADLLNVETE